MVLMLQADRKPACATMELAPGAAAGLWGYGDAGGIR